MHASIHSFIHPYNHPSIDPIEWKQPIGYNMDMSLNMDSFHSQPYQDTSQPFARCCGAVPMSRFATRRRRLLWLGARPGALELVGRLRLRNFFSMTHSD